MADFCRIPLCKIPRPHTEEKIHTAVDYLKDTQVDALCWCLGTQKALKTGLKLAEFYLLPVL